MDTIWSVSSQALALPAWPSPRLCLIESLTSSRPRRDASGDQADYSRVRQPYGTESLRFRNPRNNLNLKIEAGEPVDSDCRPVWIRRIAYRLVPYSHDPFKLGFRICVKGGHIDHVIKGAARRLKHCVQVIERTLYLVSKIRFG